MSSVGGDGPADGERGAQIRVQRVVGGVGLCAQPVQHLAEERARGRGRNDIEDVCVGQAQLVQPIDVASAATFAATSITATSTGASSPDAFPETMSRTEPGSMNRSESTRPWARVQ